MPSLIWRHFLFINVRLYNGKHMKVDEFKEREEVENDRCGTDEPL